MKIPAYTPSRTALGLALRQAGVLSFSATLAIAPVHSYATDLSDVPLASQATAAVKPNILFVLDDSGSMSWEYMPDEMGGNETLTSFKSSACNTVYFNPSLTYQLPKTSTGTSYAASSYASAETNGFDTAGSNTNLGTSFKAHGSDTSQAAYYYTVSPTPATNSAACLSAPSSSSAAAHTITSIHGGVTYTWTKALVSAGQQQNFANWYSYYRTRMLMMKSAAGLAFQSISSAYRVGFITINPGSPVDSSRYLKISDFDAAHRVNWYSKLYNTGFNGSTPLRPALSRAGLIFAGKLNTGLTSGIPTADDPVQYSCQQNFTILTTDGYWNGGSGEDLNGTSFSGVSTDSDVTVTPKPMHDGSATSTVVQAVRTKDDYSWTSTGSCGSGKGKHRRTRTIWTLNTPPGGTPPGTITSGPSNTTLTSCITMASKPLPANTDNTVTNTVTLNTGGASDTLADVAEYYYRTDLRATTWNTTMNHATPAVDVSENNVPKGGTGTEDDKAIWQHMTTFTLGLGLFGTLQFSSDYKTDTTPGTVFNNIRAGTTNWPDPAAGNSQKADDLWHTAVNGRGQAFSASNPDAVIAGLQTALAGVNARVGSAAAAATSSLEPVAGDNFIYTASYETQSWVGDVQAKEIDLATGTVLATPAWSVATKLLLRTGSACDTRTIKLFRSGTTDNLVDFKAATDTCLAGTQTASGATATALNATELGWYSEANLATLSQFDTATSGMTAAQKTAAAGNNMVNFLRGQRGKEDYAAGDVNALYRLRSGVMGDIINAQPQYVKAAIASYSETLNPGYAAYKTTASTRTPMVYVAANDGMLHAFYAGTSPTDPVGGDEAWTYIPRLVAPDIWRLADTNYKSLHKFSVDGSPVYGDVYDSATASWKTVLVGGLNKGGKGFYALDITNPTQPKALWEFGYSATCYDGTAGTAGADCNLGYSYGNPSIAKLSNGTWAVFVTSGYNNVNGATNDGVGYLYVLNAMTGQIIRKISTGTGTAGNPSGLGKLNVWVNDANTNNVAERVYGVDLLGNLWRFDVNGAPALGGTATRIATFLDASSNPQPITTKPALSEINTEPFVYVATGRYLGATDIGNNPVQSVYAIRDTLTATAYTNPRTSLKQNTIGTQVISGVTTRTSTCATGCTSTDGWFADLPDTGERVNVDMKLQLGTLTVASNVPQNNACNIGGYSYINFFSYSDGLAVATSTNASVGFRLSDSLAVGINIIRLPSGQTVAITTTSDAQQVTTNVPVAGDALAGRRVSWRELGE